MVRVLREKAQVSQDKKVQDWNDDEIGAIREAVSQFKIEGELRSEVSLNIKRLMDIGFEVSVIELVFL
jgi:small subunit ribosomal protein S13